MSIKQLSLIFAIIVLLFCFNSNGQETNSDEIVYTDMYGTSFIIESDLSSYKQADVVDRIVKCSYSEQCLEINDSVLILAPVNIIKEANDNGFSLYKLPKSERIELNVEKKKLIVFESEINGFAVNVLKFSSDNTIEVIGSYFYSPKKGILSFEHRFKSYNRKLKSKVIQSHTIVLSSSKGIFAR